MVEPGADADLLQKPLGTEDCGELGFSLREKNQAGVDPDVSSRECERIDGRIVDGEKQEIERCAGNGCHQPVADFVQVTVDFRILQVSARKSNLTNHRLAQSALLRERQVRSRRIAEIGQILRNGNRYDRQHRDHNQGNRPLQTEEARLHGAMMAAGRG